MWSTARFLKARMPGLVKGWGAAQSDSMTDNETPPSPIRPTDDEARTMARRLMDESGHAALGVFHPDTGFPHVSRILVAPLPGVGLVTLVSSLALHTRALQGDPRCSVMLGEPPGKGDPLAFARMTIAARARFLPKSPEISARFLARHPKSRLYVDFVDFSFVLLSAEDIELNGGFGRAYRLSHEDLMA